MKRVFIVHRWEGSPQNDFYPWLKRELEERGFKVIVPIMPDTNHPKIDVWVPHLKEQVGTIDKDTYFVGHSMGGQTVLRYLASLSEESVCGGVVLVASFTRIDQTVLERDGEEITAIAKPWLETPIHWAKILPHATKFTCIFSDDDPYVALSETDVFKKNLGAKIVLEHNKGHFDDGHGVTELPSALKSILELINIE